MDTASRLYLGAPAAPDLLRSAATTLAYEPGQMCLISLSPTASVNTLQPVEVAHVNAAVHARLQRVLACARGLPADAFSRAVCRTRRALRLPVHDPRVLRLWLPKPYWPYVEELAVSSVMAAAIVRQRRVLGAVLLWRQAGMVPFDAIDQEYVAALARRLAVGL